MHPEVDAGAVMAVPAVTIVIPVYADPEGVERCIASVLEHASEPWAETLIVNDCGPEADRLEGLILGLIRDRPRMRYERNPRNLGFVATCNRAVLELDTTDNDVLLLNSDAVLTSGALAEMRDVLNLSERHGAVCPRSNDATIASIPVFRREPGTATPERAVEVFEALSSELPRYYVAPVAVGFCFLARRRLIRNHGLFDEVYGAGYNEENDFCLRINEFGYSSLVANHALVFHASSSSFGQERRSALDAANREILLDRYPFYPQLVAQFVRTGFTATDRFADVLVPARGARRRVLLDVHHLSKHYDGTTKNVLSILEHLRDHPAPPSIEVVLAAYPDTVEFFRLEEYGLRVLDYRSIDEIFDLGISIVPVTSVGQLATLNRVCARIAVAFLDVIALRTYRHLRQTPMKPVVMQEALRWADRVLAISNGSLDDLALLFPTNDAGYRARTTVVTQGSARKVGVDHSSLTAISHLEPRISDLIDAGGYVLVMGNGFAHKQVPQSLRALVPEGRPVLALADQLVADAHPLAAVALSGTLTDAELDRMYDNAAVVVIPSAYEGFGLSIAEAAQHGQQVVVYDTLVAREVVGTLAVPNVRFFATFDELPGAVDAAIATPVETVADNMRTLRDYARDLWTESVALLDTPIDRTRLEARDAAISPLAAVAESSLSTAEDLLHQNAEILASTSFRLSRRIARVASLARRLTGRTTTARRVHVDRSAIDQT